MSEINEIARKRVVDRLLRAIGDERLKKSEAAEFLGIKPPDLSHILDSKYWNRSVESVFNKVFLWVNSGQTLREYSVKHGKVIADDNDTIINLVKTKHESDKEPVKIYDDKKQEIRIDLQLNIEIYVNGKRVTV